TLFRSKQAGTEESSRSNPPRRRVWPSVPGRAWKRWNARLSFQHWSATPITGKRPPTSWG
ncbi:MAG: hypothetical protein PHT55_08245, partial [Spirochaetales bacterium]|nr:hypothetical protein [Spirochaetales bacterium]